MANNKVQLSNGTVLIDLTDATATASDILSGYTAYGADGTKITGTASGGGGAASNFVTGTFTTGSSTGTTETVTIPYTGTGYPIAAMVYIEGGAYNPDISDWYDSTQRYAVGQWTMNKSITTSAPSYKTSGTENQGAILATFKNSSSTATSYARTGGMNTNTFNASATANDAAVTCVRFRSATQLSIFIASSSYGLMADMTYRYHIIYSE